MDIEEDKQHPEKVKKKPLASGELSVRTAYGLLILFIGIIIVSLLFLVPNLLFAIYLMLMFITGQLYTHIFKHYAFIDILTLALGYVWRTLSGSILIDQAFVSAWLILAIYEVALFLVIAKRKGDLVAMGSQEDAIKHKKIYNSYSKTLLDQFHVITAGAIFITYSIYLIFKFDLDFNSISEISFHFFEYLSIFTIPIVLYILMRYMYLTTAKPKIARNPEKAFFDKGILVAGLIFGVILLNAFYYNEIFAILEAIIKIFSS
jgi:4-hydroxybenzoate polyprenyltransferase